MSFISYFIYFLTWRRCLKYLLPIYTCIKLYRYLLLIVTNHCDNNLVRSKTLTLNMSMPSLRQPKMVKKAGNKKPLPPLPPKAQNTNVQVKQDFLIVTLKGGKKLVVSSDAYHGILTAGELYRCVFCETEMTLDVLCKERHKGSQNHRKVLENYPHLEEYKENLIRKITAGTHYCTICNVVVLSHFLHKHLDGEAHLKQLEQAFTRSETYMPTIDKKSEEYPPLRVPK